MPTDGEMEVPTPWVSVTRVTLHAALVQSLIAAALFGK
jgi:hypothetical protein